MKLLKDATCIALLLFNQHVHAQLFSHSHINNTDSFYIYTPTYEDGDKYIISCGMGDLLYNKMGGSLMESFPYTSKDLSTGVTTTQTFNGELKKAFSYNIFLIDMLDFEDVVGMHSFDGAIGIKTDPHSNGSIYFKAGYGYVFPLNFLKWHDHPFLQLRISADVYYIFYRELIGQIDNNDKIVNLMGFTANNTFVLGARVNNSGSIFEADHINIDLMQSDCMITPKITLTNRARETFGSRRALYWGIDIGWFLPIIQQSLLQIVQSDNSSNTEINPIGMPPITGRGATATFNNKTITTIPSIAGWYFGLNVGIQVVK